MTGATTRSGRMSLILPLRPFASPGGRY
jgi:hypothetical protein